MTYCLNPTCQNPTNPGDALFCQNCGTKLRLGDRYRALAVIGQGGFGRTFLAVDEQHPDCLKLEAADLPEGSKAPAALSLSRADALTHLKIEIPPAALCVIKQFLPLGQGDPRKAMELFRQEAERLDCLGQHPQIPRLLAHFEQTEGQYLIQEFIDGRNLDELLAAKGAFNETQIRHLLNSLLPVLDFIHSQRVIHRDIKPENIIFRAANAEDEADDAREKDISPSQAPASAPPALPGLPAPALASLFLVDFGASKYASTTALARTGTMIGSAGYAAPEQVMGKADFASDLYSLGVTCIHLLTATHPFDLYSASEDGWVWQNYLTQPVSDRLSQILNKMLCRATSQRYHTASEIMRDLKLKSTPVVRTAARVPLGMASRRSALSLRATESRLTLAASAQTWRCVRALTGHEGVVTTVAVSPDGLLLASGSTDKTIKLWSLETGDLLHTFGGRSLRHRGHSDRISTLAFSPDSLELMSGSDDCTLKQWDISTRRLIRTLSGHNWLVSSISISQNGQVFASGGGDGQINLWNLETGERLATLSKHRDRVSALRLSPDGQTLVSGSYDKTIRLWDLRGDRLIDTLRGHSDRISALVLTPDWQTLISAGWDKTLRFWHLGRQEQGRSLLAHKDFITCLALDPTGTLLASGSEDNRIRLWELAPNDQGVVCLTARPLTLPGSWSVTAIVFSPDGQSLVSSSADETVRIWVKDES